MVLRRDNIELCLTCCNGASVGKELRAEAKAGLAPLGGGGTGKYEVRIYVDTGKT